MVHWTLGGAASDSPALTGWSVDVASVGRRWGLDIILQPLDLPDDLVGLTGRVVPCLVWYLARLLTLVYGTTVYLSNLSLHT